MAGTNIPFHPSTAPPTSPHPRVHPCAGSPRRRKRLQFLPLRPGVVDMVPSTVSSERPPDRAIFRSADHESLAPPLKRKHYL